MKIYQTIYWIKSNLIENISCITKCEWLSDRQTDGLQELLELIFGTKKRWTSWKCFEKKTKCNSQNKSLIHLIELPLQHSLRKSYLFHMISLKTSRYLKFFFRTNKIFRHRPAVRWDVEFLCLQDKRRSFLFRLKCWIHSKWKHSYFQNLRPETGLTDLGLINWSIN